MAGNNTRQQKKILRGVMVPLTTSDKRREWGSNPCESDESPDLKTGALATLPSLHNQIISTWTIICFDERFYFVLNKY